MTRRSRAVAIALAVALLLGAVVIVWRLTGDDTSRRRRRGDARAAKRIDVARFRTDYQTRLEHARRVVERQRALRQQRRAAVDGGVRLMRDGGRMMLEPECILGPAELCAILDDPVTDCDAGDGRACIAVGQYLADTPPRPMVATAFFLYACQVGDQEGCTLLDRSKDERPFPCEEDPLRCSWVAFKTKDHEKLADACSLGVADACSWVSLEYEKQGEVARARAYLETGCQLGSPLMCSELGRRLLPGCKPEDNAPCYPPEPDEAAAALAIACEVGFTDAC